MSKAVRWLFSKVIYTCHHCGAWQRIPLRRLHTFERFHRLLHGEAVLIACPMCAEGIQIPSSYRTHNGYDVEVDPLRPPRNAFIHAFY